MMGRRALSFFLLTWLAALPAAAEEGNASQPLTITPHRAIYEMGLGSVKNGSSISNVTGKMMFEWADACDGWAVQQHLKLHFSYAEGDESDVSSTIITWESKDGKHFRFNVRRVVDGKETENFRGKALLSDDGGQATYSAPEDKKAIPLTPNTVFPSWHTALILQKALGGEKIFSRPVFDGSDEEGVADVSTFISARRDSAKDETLKPALRNNTLIQDSFWPIRLAFFKIKSEMGTPDYEMNLDLQDNGVSRFMQLDYDNFSVSGVLTDLEPLPAPGC